MDKFDYKSNMDSKNGRVPKIPLGNVLIIYTALSILMSMKLTLGLEAMLEYMTRYMCIMEKNNPQLRVAVQKALSIVDVEKLYREALNEK